MSPIVQLLCRTSRKRARNTPYSSCAKRDNDGKKIKLMVLMSTSHVVPHTSGYISSIVLFLTQDLVQAVLTSTFSFFVFSFFSFSCP